MTCLEFCSDGLCSPVSHTIFCFFLKKISLVEQQRKNQYHEKRKQHLTGEQHYSALMATTVLHSVAYLDYAAEYCSFNSQGTKFNE